MISRVFVDITTSLMLAGEQPIGISHLEHEVARRLLLFSPFNFIPVVFGNDGRLFALSPEQVALIFSSKPITNSHRNKQVISHPTGECDAAAAKERKARRKPGTLPLRSKLRYAALAFIAWMPHVVREDVRAILIHTRQLAKTVTSGAVREDVGAILIHARRVVRTIIYRKPEPVAASTPARSVLPTLRMVVHPHPGDVLWTAGALSCFVPLRTIGEMRARGLRVVTTCDDVIRVSHLQSSQTSVGAELLMADAVGLLDASDLVLAVSERTRRELLALATRLGRATPGVHVLQTGSGLRRLLDPDSEEFSKTSVAPDVSRRELEIARPDTALWDEVAAAVKERLQMLVEETGRGWHAHPSAQHALHARSSSWR
jgi:hypothetical protein